MTFGPQDAENYHRNLLKEYQALRPYNLIEYPGIFFAMPPHRPDLDPRQPQTPWGTVIGQKIWTTRNQHEFLCPPIFFVNRNGGLGLPLNQAAGGDCMSLRGASQPLPLDETCSTHAQIRINWHGYSPWSEQISIRTQTPRQEIIRLEKFVRHVATKVKKFMVEGRQPKPYSNGEQRWFIGDGGITPNDVVLIGVVHVSQAKSLLVVKVTAMTRQIGGAYCNAASNLGQHTAY
ncbi:hypothetical protein EDB87DRAFT_1823332 [Lactarius vividus]|nr:hypothetical protein EDB87DRAFT_1823332 [Lactarius vividus]